MDLIRDTKSKAIINNNTLELQTLLNERKRHTEFLNLKNEVKELRMIIDNIVKNEQ
tara:strand:+ start:2981 stop:3148 length:168 start_codon:yes stop_codon:yes gene_type:complete